MEEKTWDTELREFFYIHIMKEGIEITEDSQVRINKEGKITKGSMVRIKRDSEFAYQNKGIGLVTSDPTVLGESVISVLFYKNGSCYRKKDLELVELDLEKELRKKLKEEHISYGARLIKIPEKTLEACLEGKIKDLEKIPDKYRESLYDLTHINAFRPKIKFSKFIGKKLNVNGEKYIINFLEGDFGSDVFNEYHNIVCKDYPSIDTLDKLSYNDYRRVARANVFSTILINKIIRDRGFRTANLLDLGKALEQRVLDLSSSIINCAIILRTQCGKNGALSKYLVKQIKERDGKIKYPVLIPLTSLDLDDPNSFESSESPYKLSFKLREDGEIIHAPQLTGIGPKDRKFSKIGENGLPIMEKNGDKSLSTIIYGISNVSFYASNKIRSNQYNLYDAGRENHMVVLAPEKIKNNGGGE